LWSHRIIRTFFYPGADFGATSMEPGYSVLMPLYNYGGVAVQYFFTLSGFIFFYYYSSSIFRGAVGP
jgi:hypothetical protein